jgi:hypothetical protein
MCFPSCSAMAEKLVELGGKALELCSSLQTAFGASLKKTVPANFGLGVALPSYRQAGCPEQTGFPYLEVIVIFTFVTFAFEFYLVSP